jgi:hypothetical protein
MRIPRTSLLLMLLGVIMRPHDVRAQDPARLVLPDSVEEGLLRRFPCPRPVPRGWVAADSTNGGGVRYSLLQAAARGLEDRSSPLSNIVDPWTSRCVTLEEQLPLPKIGTLWRVTFIADSLRGASALVDRFGRVVSLEPSYHLKPGSVSSCKPAVLQALQQTAELWNARRRSLVLTSSARFRLFPLQLNAIR